MDDTYEDPTDGDGYPMEYPPFPRYKTKPLPPSLANTIVAGRDLRLQHKSALRKPLRPLPKPAKPRTPRTTDVKMSKRAMRAHARHTHDVILTDRLERISKPLRRHIIYLWREHAKILPPETINRFRSMLDADEPFNPDQAYEYFLTLKKHKKKDKEVRRVTDIKKDMLANLGAKRYVWAQNATVALAKGIQQKISKPGTYALADGMLRLSDIILDQICKKMKMRTPSRRNMNPKAKFLMEMSDKVAVWIDEILSESDERMLMMDFDEDEDMKLPGGEEPGFTDDFLDMMMSGGGAGGAGGPGGPGGAGRLMKDGPAHLKFKGDMADAFQLLTREMNKKGNENLISHGKFNQTYKEGAKSLKQTGNFSVSNYDSRLAEDVNHKLTDVTKDATPKELSPAMTNMVDICSNFLAQNAEEQKDKGPAFKLLVNSLRSRPKDAMYHTDKILKTNAEAANELEKAKGFNADHDDPQLTNEIKNNMKKMVDNVTSPNLKNEMSDTVDKTSKYLAQKAIDDAERGPAFDLMIQALEKKGGEAFTSGHPYLSSKNAAAYALTTAPGLSSMDADPNTTSEFQEALHKAVDSATPENMKSEMNEEVLLKTAKAPIGKNVVDRSGKYLSAYDHNRGPAIKALVDMMKSKPNNVFATRNNYTMDYKTGAQEIENAPTLVPYLPVKDIADEGKEHLAKDMKGVTPKELEIPMKGVINDASKYLSQMVAMNSGVGGEQYQMNLLAEVNKSLGDKPLVKLKTYGQTFAESGDELKHAGPIEEQDIAKQRESVLELQRKIATNLQNEVPTRLGPGIADGLADTTQKAANFLGSNASKKGEAADYLVNAMKDQGEAPLAKLQGYEQTFNDGAKRIENTPSLGNDKVDKQAFKTVKNKLDALVKEKQYENYANVAEHLPGIVEESAKFLAAPVPETNAEKKQVIADLMARKSNEKLAEEGSYKMTYKEGGEEIKNSPAGVTEAHDEQKKNELTKQIEAVMPDQKMKNLLKEPTEEGAAYLSNVLEDKGGLQQDQKALDEQAAEAEAKKKAAAMAAAAAAAGNDPVAAAKAAVLAKEAEAAKALAEAGNDPVLLAKAAALAKEAEAAKALAEAGNDPVLLAKAAALAKEAEAAKAAAAAAAAGNDPVLAAKAAALAKEAEALKAAAEAGNDPVLLAKAAALAKEAEAAKAAAAAAAAGNDPVLAAKAAALAKEAEAAKAAAAAAGNDPVAAARAAALAKEAEAAKAAAEAGNDPVLLAKAAALAKEAEAAKALAEAGNDPVLLAKAAALAKEAEAAKAAAAAAAAGNDPVLLAKAAALAKEAEAAKAAAAAAVADAEDKDGGGGASGKKKSGKGGSSRDGDGTVDALDGLLPGETEEQRRRRLAEAEAHRKYEEAERKRLGDKEHFAQLAQRMGITPGNYVGGALGADYDPEHATALDILHQELRKRGDEVLYQQPQTNLTHVQASDWLNDPEPIKVDKAVRESSDTARLHKKFEKKLNGVVTDATPPVLVDAMQDVVIEGSRRLSEYFVAKNYKALVHEALISEMQKRGNEILTEVDGAAETFFFAAQRLKKTGMMDIQSPCYQVAHQLLKKLDDMMRSRSMARKLSTTVKDHTKAAADYLSALVTKPDDEIEAYIALLGEMEAAGDTLLFEGDIPKSYWDSAAYLRQLTSLEDKIGYPDRNLRYQIENKLANLMSNVAPSASYSQGVMDRVIAQQAGLLVSYIMLQGEKTEALKILIREMDKAEDTVLLRHGAIRKSFREGSDMLRDKNTDQLRGVTTADPVVARKIQIKLNSLMTSCPCVPDTSETLMDDVIEDVTMYLAVHFLQPQVIQVCKCMKNVFVQCELWCDEILRRITRPCCTCSRHLSTSVLQDLAPTEHLRGVEGTSHVYAPGVDISLRGCPSIPRAPPRGERLEPQRECPTGKPAPGCNNNFTTSFLLCTSTLNKTGFGFSKISPSSSTDTPFSIPFSASPTRRSKHCSPLKTLLADIHADNQNFMQRQHSPSSSEKFSDFFPTFNSPSFLSKASLGTTSLLMPSSPNTMYAEVPEKPVQIKQARSGFSCKTPIITTDKMADWHAMMVSLMWNIQAWRDWIQENVDRALAYQYNPEDTEDNWSNYQRRVSTEALQWRQYSMFSRQLTLRLFLRYKDKKIVSPTRATVKTKMYLECQEKMLEIVDMFNRWTQWLTLVVKETDSLSQVVGSDIPLYVTRWNHLKDKVKEYANDWVKYNMHLKVSWEQKNSMMIAEHLPSWNHPGPVWVVSACGAVPSGAVTAGMVDGEVIWVARTTHRYSDYSVFVLCIRSSVLPAALYPSKHCCLVYSEGVTHHYTKYQVMCNAEVRWVAWRGGSIGGRAVRVAPGVHVGRVDYRGNHLLGPVHEPQYRCHIVIFGRPFAFNSYELLMLAEGNEDQN